MRPSIPLVLVLALAACGGTGSSPGSDGGSQNLSDCNSLSSPNMTAIHKNHHAGPPPAMTGGTIADGTYFLTAMDQWNGENGDTPHVETWFYQGNQVGVVSIESSATLRASGTFTTSGNMITSTLDCGVSMTATSAYTASGNTLTIVNANDPNETHTFTKQ